MNQKKLKTIIQDDGLELITARGWYYVRDYFTKHILVATRHKSRAIRAYIKLCEDQYRAFNF